MQFITRKLAVSAITFLFLLFAVAPVYASITVGSNGLYLGFSDDSYYWLRSGTYTSISRIDNVWYVDGTTITREYTGTVNVLFSNWYIAVGFLILIPVVLAASIIVMLLKTRDPKHVFPAVISLIGTFIWIVVGIILILQFQTLL